MKYLTTLALLVASLLLAGCASDKIKLELNRTYVLEWIGERPLIDNSYLTITLDEDGRAFGTGGCNHWFASYTMKDQQISFGQTGSTRMMCAPALMEQEQRFFDALGKVQHWDLSETEQLRLWPAEGKPIRMWPEASGV